MFTLKSENQVFLDDEYFVKFHTGKGTAECWPQNKAAAVSLLKWFGIIVFVYK